ncbi:MAG: LamG-like jellyroll fold domain-containing protein [Flavobacteriales bacterium]
MNRNRLLILFVFIVATHFCVAQLPTDSLRAHYSFSNNLLDVSGNENHITQGSGIFATDRFGNASSSLQLDGVADSLTFPIAEFSPIQNDFTISLWYKTNSPQVMSLFSSHEFPTDTTENFEVELNSNNLYYLENNPSIWYQTYTRWNGNGNAGNALVEGAPGVFTKGEWCMMAVQREADTLRVFRNHVLYAQSTDFFYGGVLGAALDLVMSAFPNRFKGTVDDIRFYNRALSQAEIDLLYFENQAFVFVAPKPTDAFVQGMNVLAYWEYDDTQVSDSINVEFRIDGGAWQPAIHSHMAYEYYTYIDMSFPAGTEVEVRVTDVANPLLTASSGTFEVSEYTWVEVNNSLPFTARDGSGLLNYNNKMWLLGGWDPPYHPPNYTHNEIWSSVDGANWNYEGDAAWEGRHISGWMVYDNAMWLVGSDPQAGCLRDVWRSTDGVNWELILDTIPEYAPRYNACYAPLADRMLMYGGEPCGVAWQGHGLNDVWTSEDGIAWTQLENTTWHGRGMQLNNCVDDEGNSWFLGGSNDADRRSYNEVWKTTDGTEWTLVNESAPWTGRYWHTVAWFDSKMWLLSGMATGTEMGDAWYSEDGIDWKELKAPLENSPAGSRHALSTTVYDNALWYMCGVGTNNVWKIVDAFETHIEEEVKEEILIAIPNPADGSCTVQIPANCMGYSLCLYDITGRCISCMEIESSQHTISLAELNAGVYLVQVNNPLKSSVLVVKR